MPDRLRVAFLCYRGNPHSGGQGVYTRHLTRELVALGHAVTVFAGPPYPELDARVALVRVPSLDLYRQPDPFRVPRAGEFGSAVDVVEFALMCTGGFPEPLTFSLRAWRLLRGRRAEFDLVHDNQCLGWGIAALARTGWPVVATIHHPVTVDRDVELAHAHSRVRKAGLRRWYGFVGMQKKVARSVPRFLTGSHASRRDLAEHLGIAPRRTAVVPVGVDHLRFRPLPDVERIPGRLVTTVSADVPLKGLVPLLEALAKIRTEAAATLVVVGRPRPGSGTAETVGRLGLEHAVRFVSGLSDEDLVHLYAESEVAVVPSLYEGFSLPAVEAMACGVPVVATTGGALPEVVGDDGVTALLVRPGDPDALARALLSVLREPELRRRLSENGRRRVLERFTWRATAEGTAHQYRQLLGARRPPPRC